MADLKISQLTPTTDPGVGDQFIINKGDATTQKVSFESLLNALGSGGGTDGGFAFKPIFVNFTEGTGGTTQYTWGETTLPGESTTRTNLIDITGVPYARGQKMDTVTMPSTTDACVAIWTSSCALVHNPKRTDGSDSVYTYGTFGNRVYINGDGVVVRPNAAGIPNRASVQYKHMMPALTSSYAQTQSRDMYGQGSSITRVFIIEYNKGGTTIEFDAEGYAGRTLRTSFEMSPGRMCLIPFDKALLTDNGLDMLRLTVQLMSDGIEEEPITIPTEEEIEREAASIFRARVAKAANAIQATIDYDAVVLADSTLRADLKTALEDIFALKNQFANVESANAALNEILKRDAVVIYVSFPVGTWETFNSLLI